MARVLAAAVVCLMLAGMLVSVPVSAAQPGEIRVVLADSADTATIAGNIAWRTADGGSGSSTELAKVTLSGNRLNLDSAQFDAASGRLIATPVNGYIRFSSREYRGRFEFFIGKGGGLVVLNVLPLEDYLLGVVPGEMPAGWPPEALKAQAVAARTYAVSRMMVNREMTYDVYSTVADQVYRGLSGEDQRATAAIHETAGQIVTFDGLPITAYYSADAGGFTREGSLPYLRAVPSFDPESPHGDWQVELSADQLSRIASGMWQGIGRLVRIEAANDPVSGHLTSLLLIGESGRVKLNPSSLRKALGYDVMKSTRARIYAAGAPTAAPVVPPQDVHVPVISIEPFPVERPAQPAGEITTGTTEINDYEKPYVQNAEDLRDYKLRRMYAFNGRDLKMIEQVFAVTDLNELISLPPPAFPIGGETPPPPRPVEPGPTPGFIPDPDYDETSIELNGGGIVIRGSGYGHGMGMSQWGARQLAANGWSYADILRYFYTGVQLTGWNGEIPTVPAAEGSAFYEPFDPGN